MIGDTVTLAHGAGGKQTSELIDRVFKKHFSNPHLTADDAAVLTLTGNRIAVSTDGFVVSPAFSRAAISASCPSAGRSMTWPAWEPDPSI